MSISLDLARKSEEVAVKQAALHQLFQGATPDIDTIKSANAELADIVKARDALAEMAEMERQNSASIKAYNDQSRQPGPRQTQSDGALPDADVGVIKSLADMLTGNTRYQDAIKSGSKFRGLLGTVPSIKALLTTADMVGQTQRMPLILNAEEDRTTADLMLQGTTSAAAIEYYEETTYTNAAAEVAEGAAKPEAAVDFTLRTESVRKIAVWVPVTDEMLADNEAFESYLRARLGFMIKQREELQILVGDGTAPNISGILDRSGIQTQAKGADPSVDAIYKAITKVRNTGFVEPTAVVIHPNDWQDIRLLRDGGTYVMGSPLDAGPERVWGLPVRVTSNITEGTAVVGAFRPDAQIFRRGGIELAVSDSHDTYFIYNKLAVRAEERIALAIYRVASFCTVTGL